MVENQRFLSGSLLQKPVFLCLLLLLNLWGSPDLDVIAISDLQAKGVSVDEARVVGERLRVKLIQAGAFRVMERSMMEELLKEQGFQQSGACDLSECQVQMGRLLGVDKMIMGSLGRLGSIYAFSLRVLDVETGEILHAFSEEYQGPIEGLLNRPLQKLVSQLVQTTQPLSADSVSFSTKPSDTLAAFPSQSDSASAGFSLHLSVQAQLGNSQASPSRGSASLTADTMAALPLSAQNPPAKALSKQADSSAKNTVRKFSPMDSAQQERENLRQRHEHSRILYGVVFHPEQKKLNDFYRHYSSLSSSDSKDYVLGKNQLRRGAVFLRWLKDFRAVEWGWKFYPRLQLSYTALPSSLSFSEGQEYYESEQAFQDSVDFTNWFSLGFGGVFKYVSPLVEFSTGATLYPVASSFSEQAYGLNWDVHVGLELGRQQGVGTRVSFFRGVVPTGFPNGLQDSDAGEDEYLDNRNMKAPFWEVYLFSRM